MKKARGVRSNNAPKAAALPPPLPPFEDLDKLAADETPSLASAWWITHQASEHVFAMIARGDPRTGAPLARPLTEILTAIGAAIATGGSRPFPCDRLLIAAEFAAGSVEHLLDHHRHRILRTHEQLPFHQIREVDTRSMAWLARQPGRNIREKLSGRTHALGVKRAASVDTTENRVLRSFAKFLVQRASRRLEFTGAYDGTSDDNERIRRMKDCVRLCDDRMRRSELADVPVLTRMQPNNVLLSDPHYSRVFRAWKWLRDDEEALRRSWADALQRAGTLLCWMVAAQIASHERVTIADTLGRVRTGWDDDHKLGVEVLGAADTGVEWFLNPLLCLLVLPAGSDDRAFRIRITLAGEFLIAKIAMLDGEGILDESPVSSPSFEIRALPDHLKAGRGIGISIAGLGIAHADIAGLAPIAMQMARQILQCCGVNSRAEKYGLPAHPVIATGARVGIELGNTSLHVSGETVIPLTVASWALALDLPGDGDGFEWLDGRAGREFVIGASDRSLWAIGDVIDANEQADPGMIALAAEHMLGRVASELALPADARIAYAVPDAVDEFSQRSLRSAFGASFHGPVPVWRSVAAAMAWVSVTGEQAPHPNQSIVVVDTEFGGVSLTVLTARYNNALALAHPTSQGLYWERKPPLPPDEQLEQLGWPHQLRAYARWLVARELEALEPELQERIVDDLVRSGKIAELAEKGGSIFVQVPSDPHMAPGAVELFDDPEWFDHMVERWIRRLGDSVGEVLAEARIGQARRVMIGGPCAYTPSGEIGGQTGRIKSFHEAKGFGFIAPDGGGNDLFFHVNSWVSDRHPRVGDPVEYEIGSGKKGPEAKHVSPVPRLAEWLRRNPHVSSLELALGARECLLRLDSGSFTWREWLPELSLEVVRDGHFGKLPLLRDGKSFDPFLGRAMEFEVPETLTLACGQAWFSFPLLVGQQGHRPIPWEARLDSPAFPLDHDVRARLTLSYRYGLDNSYELVVTPASPKDAPFARIEAKWIRGGEATATGTSKETLEFCAGSWADDDVPKEKFLSATRDLARLSDERFQKFLFGVTRACWGRGRSCAAAPWDIRQAFPDFRDVLLYEVNRTPTLSIKQELPALDVLTLLHEDAPVKLIEILLQFDDEAADTADLYKKASTMMAMLVGDGTGERARLLMALLERLKRHTNADTFDGPLAGITMRALGNAAWRHPDFIFALPVNPGAITQIIAQCRRSLQNLMTRVPFDVTSEENCWKVVRQLGTPFRDSCEMLLALLRVDPSNPEVAPILCGSPSANALAKAVRQLDARFAAIVRRFPAIDVDGFWRVGLEVDLPEELGRMSPVAFALNSYLTKGAGANLVRVTEVVE